MNETGQGAVAKHPSDLYPRGQQIPVLAERYFKVAIVFLLLGLLVGLHMSISNNHSAHAAHAHINLVGWVTSALFGVYYALHPVKADTRLATAQFWIYVAGCVVMLPMLYFLVTGNESVEPLVAAGSMLVFLGILLFAVVVFSNE